MSVNGLYATGPVSTEPTDKRMRKATEDLATAAQHYHEEKYQPRAPPFRGKMVTDLGILSMSKNGSVSAPSLEDIADAVPCGSELVSGSPKKAGGYKATPMQERLAVEAAAAVRRVDQGLSDARKQARQYTVAAAGL